MQSKQHLSQVGAFSPSKSYCLRFFAWGDSVSKTLGGLRGDVSKPNIISWFRFIWELMSQDLIDQNIILGGPGRTVEIDGCSFHGRQKYGLGRLIPQDPWVFGAMKQKYKGCAFSY